MKILHLSMADWAEASCGFTAEQEGWAIRLTRIYASREKLLDSDGDNARMMALDARVWKRAKAFLVERAGFFLEDGFIKHERIEKELTAYREHCAKAVENGKLGGRPKHKSAGLPPDFLGTSARLLEEVREKSTNISHAELNEIKEITKPSPPPTPSPHPRSEEREESKISRPVEVAGLNGSTSVIVKDVARWFNELNPDTDGALVMVEKIATIYGPDAVKDAYAELSADFADNKRLGRPTYKLLLSYAQKAKERPRGQAKTQFKDFKTAKLDADRAMLEKMGFDLS